MLDLHHLRELLLGQDGVQCAGAVFDAIVGIATLIGTALKIIGDTLKDVVLWIIQSALPAIVASVRALGGLMRRGFSFFVRGLKHLLVDIVKGRLVGLWKHVLALTTRLNTWLHTHLAWLFKLRQFYDKWFKRVVVPVLNVIHRMRAILQIFRIFHFKWAERLDAFLGKIEAKIIKNTLLIRKILNQVITTINLIVDPSLILKRNFLASTLLSWVGAVKRVVAFGFSRSLTEQEAQRQQEDKELLKKGTVLSSGGATPVFHPALQRVLDGLDKELKNYT